MNVILTTLNARYTHMSLSLRYLRAVIERAFGLEESKNPAKTSSKKPLNLELKEFTINQPHEWVLRTLYEAQPDCVCFSVYIWNVEATLKLASSLKKVLPELTILFGGPEPAYDARKYLERYPFLDGVVTGEGEPVITAFLERLMERLKDSDSNRCPKGEDLGIPGLVERREGHILDGGKAPLIQDLDGLPFPYKAEDFEAGRMLYYEGSRGCPYRCAYCLSAREPGVRRFSLERVQSDLLKFIEAGVMQVKFVDRTFNADPKRSRRLFEFIIQQDRGQTNFHFEITAALLGEEDFDVLVKARPGLFQFEIGVQSTCEEAMAAIRRPMPFERTAEACRRLAAPGNLHLHLDLIAGLPYEPYARFLTSFDEVYELNPHALQLGFLKLIPGSPLEEEASLYGYLKEEHPPYEVLGNKWMNYQDLSKLKRIEGLVDIFHNSHGFEWSLAFALQISGLSASAFFGEMAMYFRHQGLDQQAYRHEAHYGHLEAFLKDQGWFEPPELAEALLEADCLIALGKRRTLNEEPEDLKALIHETLRRHDPAVPVKQLLKRIRYQIFKTDVLAWREGRPSEGDAPGALWLGWIDTASRSPITGRYDYRQQKLR